MIMLSRTFFLMLSSCKWWNILINLKAQMNKIPILIFVYLSPPSLLWSNGMPLLWLRRVPQVLSLKRRHFMPQYGCVTSLVFRYGVSFSSYELYGMPLPPPRCHLFLLCWHPLSAFAADKINRKKSAVKIALQMSRCCADTWQKCTNVVTKKVAPPPTNDFIS